VPLHRSLRCASPELYQRVIRSISRHLVQAPAAAAAAATALVSVQQGPDGAAGLTIVQRGGVGGGGCWGRQLHRPLHSGVSEWKGLVSDCLVLLFKHGCGSRGAGQWVC
jgi:hypothetical protein